MEAFHFFHRVFHRLREKEAVFPPMFSTFSTGFSTFTARKVYTSRIDPDPKMEISGGKRGQSDNFTKESRAKNLFFHSLPVRQNFPLSDLESFRAEFSTKGRGKTPDVENLRFPLFSTFSTKQNSPAPEGAGEFCLRGF
ncbi:MAG: hypothetical protein ACI4LE_00975, partial [Faecalibacterium sp.]